MYKVFGLPYFLQLVLAIAIVLILVVGIRKLTDKARTIAQISIVSAIGLFVIFEYVGRALMISDFKIGDQLPLNTFQVFAYLSVFMLIVPKLVWKKFGYLIIVPVCAYGLIFVPAIYSVGSGFSLAVVSYVIVNALLIANSILNILWSDEELEKKDIVDSSVTYLIIVAGIHIINIILRFSGLGIHANYFGTMGDSYDLVIGWLQGIMPVTQTNMAVPLICILPLIAILVGVQFLLILPFDLFKTRRQAQENLEELIALGNMKKQQEARSRTKRRTKSQILVNSDIKARPDVAKRVNYTSTGSGFVSTQKEINVNNDHINKK